MMFEKTSAGIDSETLVAVCESDEVGYVGPGERGKLEYEGPSITWATPTL